MTPGLWKSVEDCESYDIYNNGEYIQIVYITYNRSHVTENAYYSHIFACNFLILSDICMKFE